jgi:AmiR/NasT family two-component response regulator
MQAEVPEGSIPDAFADLAEHRAAVHQASGMVSVQLGVSVEDALVAIRARAYQRGVSIGGLADDIVAQRVRLDEP